MLCDLCYFRAKKTTKMPYDQVQTCLIFPLRWASFPIKISHNTLMGTLILDVLYFDDFTLFLSLKVHFRWENCLSVGNTIYLRLLAVEGFDAIRPGYNCFISMTISVEWRCGF